jgi:pyrroline-5-carboxylate reductase
MPTSRIPVAIVGGGTMAQAIVRGGIDAGVLEPRLVGILEPDSVRRDVFRAWGVRAVKRAEELAGWLASADTEEQPGQILLAVKPQSLPEVGHQFRPLLGSDRRIIISILAGTPTAKVRAALGEMTSIIRVMSNTPAQIRKGCTAIALGAGAAEDDDALAVDIFSALGRVVRIDESLMDAFTAVAGSGPSYVFYLAEAMTKAAVEVGFDPDTAGWITRWTIAGAAALLDTTDQPPATLRAAVTSKGGTTAAAAAVLDQSAVMEIFTKAIKAARDRGIELGKSPP